MQTISLDNKIANVTSKSALFMEENAQLIETLGVREQYRDQYWLRKDPIYEDRLLWRAQTFRHIVHLLPDQSIIELGAGQGLFTQQLLRVSRQENPITAVTFHPNQARPDDLSSMVECLGISALPGALHGRQFDYVIVMDLLDKRNSSWFLRNIYELLKPGGQVLFYESNPWNVILRLRQSILQLFGEKDPRQLLSRLYAQIQAPCPRRFASLSNPRGRRISARLPESVNPLRAAATRTYPPRRTCNIAP